MLLGLGASALLVAVGSGTTRRAYRAALARAHERLSNKSLLVQSRFGPIEYAVAGAGTPVLMVHGSGGGFDQGLSFAERLPPLGHQVIAPSRFGYLRSAMPDEPSPDHQADAFADLLDALRIERLPVIGGSAGALSAIAFALRYPDRCTALVAIVPATFVPHRPPLAPLTPFAQALMRHALSSDFWFWAGLTIRPKVMVKTILATDPTLLDTASPQERARARRILEQILPLRARAAGLRTDAQLTAEPAPMPLEAVRVPTLAISVEDDRFGTFAAAQHIARTVPNARLHSWPTGGHIWIGHDEEMFVTIDAFLRSAR